jgi:N-formylglutamate amidohydrolase
MILHIPHASANIPDREGFLDEEKVQAEILKLTDWYTDDLFQSEEAIRLIAPFSRVFCDVERYREDEQEPMSFKGMGVTYTTCDDGSPLRLVTPSLRDRILHGYYDVHHLQLTALVDLQLKEKGRALIIDCHSYPNQPFIRDIDQTEPRPDFNIGISGFHTPEKWIDGSTRYFNEKGFSLGIDWPYSGTMVPLKHLNQNPNVYSIMLEVNRDLYLDKNGNGKTGRYNEIKSIVGGWLEMIGAKAMQ